MKKFFYIVAFAFLGLVLSTLLHAVVELYALSIIFGNPEQYSNTFWWTEWHLIHRVFAFGLWLLGFGLGVYYGVKFWEPYGSKPGFYHWM